VGNAGRFIRSTDVAIEPIRNLLHRSGVPTMIGLLAPRSLVVFDYFPMQQGRRFSARFLEPERGTLASGARPGLQTSPWWSPSVGMVHTNRFPRSEWLKGSYGPAGGGGPRLAPACDPLGGIPRNPCGAPPIAAPTFTTLRGRRRGLSFRPDK
jgi:hypothetical protein